MSINPPTLFGPLGELLATKIAADETIGKLEVLGLDISELILGGGAAIEILTDNFFPAFTDMRLAKNWLNDEIGGFIIDPLLESSFNIALPAPGTQAYDAIQTIRGVAGFAFLLPYGLSVLEGVGKFALGKHWPERFTELLSEIPHELGFNFFLGGILEHIYELSVGQPIEEYILEDKRPTRLDQNTVRRLLQQHKIPSAQANSYLAKLGYRDEDIAVVLELDAQNLSLAELEAAYNQQIITTAELMSYLSKLGYSDSDAIVLQDLMLIRTATEGANVYRAAVRSAYTDHVISEAQFRTLLGDINVSPASIDLEVGAIALKSEVSTYNETITNIKNEYTSGGFTESVAVQALVGLNMTSDSAQSLVSTWKVSAKVKGKTIAVSRVLGYLESGVLTAEQAYNDLLSSGYTTQDALFLVQHPTVTGTTIKYPLTKATVIAAYKDGVITLDDATKVLQQINVNQQEAELALATATYQMNKPKVTSAKTKTLTIANIEAAYKAGLMGIPTAAQHVEAMGYTSEDTQVLLAIWYASIYAKPPDGWVLE